LPASADGSAGISVNPGESPRGGTEQVPFAPLAPTVQAVADGHAGDGPTMPVLSPEPPALPRGPANCELPADPAIPPLQLTRIATDLEEPIYVTAAPGDLSRLFVIEKPGRIRLLVDGQLRSDPFLDLTDRVATSVEEMGLLGLAFHPRYADNGLLYVTYSSAPGAGNNPPNTEVLAEFRAVPGDPDHAASNERRVLTVAKPEGNHNGGNLQFRADGLLYFGLGDGGGGRDQHGVIGNGQALDTLLGKLVRIDVDGRGAGAEGQYAIPPGNFAERDARALPEIWSVGLRNPWRFSFDVCNADLYIGDVGQEGREEVDFVPGSEATGRNFGWRLMEAENCFEPNAGCDPALQDLTLPIASYPRATGQCITGGYVYRGSAIPQLRGAYLYADYQSAAFFALRMQGGTLAAEPTDITSNINPDKAVDAITSFGQDNLGEMYLTTFTGQLYRLDPR
jgi:glucose/arabinose dehydrogenase